MFRQQQRASQIFLWGIVFCMTWLTVHLYGGRSVVAGPFRLAGKEAPRRTPWTTSRILGSPEPPPPYRERLAFPKLKFDRPLLITHGPISDRIFVAEQGGKIYSFPNDPDCETADLFFDLVVAVLGNDPLSDETTGDLYGLAFHPDFENNQHFFVCYVAPGTESDGVRVSRFHVNQLDPPKCDPGSEEILITWAPGGHVGGCLKFGPDGYLYISTGDGSPAHPPDGNRVGQDVSNLQSAILRIDVNHADDERPYGIPEDNPFVQLENARGEIWAYGFRQPWRMSFDRDAGDLWVGDVGWELWETVHRVERGGNYGWSIMEGPQPVHTEANRGPTPILAPFIKLSHSMAASITGGFVYRGSRLNDLFGAYIFGDWETRRIWAARWNGSELTSLDELAEPTLRIVAFGEDVDGELFILDYDDGTIHELVENTGQRRSEDFPRRLSQTGLFTSTVEHIPAPGVVPFEVDVPQWNDHGTAERLLALPGEETILVHAESESDPDTSMTRQLVFPENAVLAKTISLEVELGNRDSRRRIETQILHYDGLRWNGYSYRWNDEQTDAQLVDAVGLDQTFMIADPRATDGTRKQYWRFASRIECARCHNPWAQHTLAFNLAQLNRECGDVGAAMNQIGRFYHMGIFTPFITEGDGEDEEQLDELQNSVSKLLSSPDLLPKLTDPYDSTVDIRKRARSYLHVNCSHCHRLHAGGTARIDLRFDHPIEDTKTLLERPMQGTFGIHDGKIISPGDPYRSILFYRMSTLGPGHMPRMGSRITDQHGLQLIRDWIGQMPSREDDDRMLRQLAALDENTIVARESRVGTRSRRIEKQAQQLAEANGRTKPNADDRQRAGELDHEQAPQRAEQRTTERQELIGMLLSKPERAVLLADSLANQRLPESVTREVISAAVDHHEPQVRDLFERFVPEERRAKRLGNAVSPHQILSLDGDLERGKELFFNHSSVQCKNCHRIANEGKSVGPALDHVGRNNNRAELLESILEPSKKIDPKYLTYLVETEDGRVLTGLLLTMDDQQVVLRDEKSKEIRLTREEMEQIVPQTRSLIPELLLRDLTGQQVADLLAFLESLK